MSGPAQALTPTVGGPGWLRALDDLDLQTGGWTAACPIYGCGGRLAIGADGDLWVTVCTGGGLGPHDEEALARWLTIDLLSMRWRGSSRGMRAWVAMVLAKTPETAAALMRGETVPETALDMRWLRRLERAGLWAS